MLVATSILALTLVLFTQITNNTVNVTKKGNHYMDVSSQARGAFDRLSQNLNSVMRINGITVTVNKASNGNDSIAFIANTRAALTTGSTGRAAVVGFEVRSSPDTYNKGVSVPMLNWGNAAVLWPTDPYTALRGAATQLGGASGPMTFDPVAPNIFRMEICFLQDDGSIVALPPEDITFAANPAAPNTGNPHYIALTKEATLNGSGRFVKAIIIGMAGLSGDVRQLVDMTALSASLPPVPLGKTPLQVWDINAPAFVTSLPEPKTPILNNLRVYQRYFYVN